MSEKEKQILLEQINNLTPVEFSKLCLKVVRKIVSKRTVPAEKSINNQVSRADKEVLIKLMIDNDIKIDEKE